MADELGAENNIEKLNTILRLGNGNVEPNCTAMIPVISQNREQNH